MLFAVTSSPEKVLLEKCRAHLSFHIESTLCKCIFIIIILDCLPSKKRHTLFLDLLHRFSTCMVDKS